HDVLTKLRNRSFYVDELNRLDRKGPHPVTVIMADLNGLKRVNDQLGHAAGDALLRRAGDEFAVLLPGTDERGGAAMIDTIRQLVELNNQFYPGAQLSFSMGAAT